MSASVMGTETAALCARNFRRVHPGTVVLAVEQRGGVHVPAFNRTRQIQMKIGAAFQGGGG